MNTDPRVKVTADLLSQAASLLNQLATLPDNPPNTKSMETELALLLSSLSMAVRYGLYQPPSGAAPTVPGAPLAPTALAGNASAQVSFGAPANGGAAITSYKVTASPGGFSATAASSPITVPGLNNGTAYTFSITATNSVGVGPASAPSNSVTPTSAQPFLINANGANNPAWNADLTFGAAALYNDTNRPQSPHTKDTRLPVGCGWQIASSAYGGQGGFNVGPYGTDISGYTYFSVDMNTPAPADQFDTLWHYLGNIGVGGASADITTPCYVDSVTGVVGPLTANAWNKNLRIPLALLGQLGIVGAYKYFLRDNSNGADLYVDNVTLIPGNLSWVYNGGQARTWNGAHYTRDASTPLNGWTDASVNAVANYAFNPSSLSVACSVTGVIDPGQSVAPTNVIQLSITANGGRWQATHSGFNVSAYDHLTFAALPTAGTHSYQVQLYNTSGAAVGSAVDPSAYTNHDWGAGAPYWTVYAIPLAAFGAIGANIGGMSIKDMSGNSSNTLYLSGIGFYI